MAVGSCSAFDGPRFCSAFDGLRSCSALAGMGDRSAFAGIGACSACAGMGPYSAFAERGSGSAFAEMGPDSAFSEISTIWLSFWGVCFYNWCFDLHPSHLCWGIFYFSLKLFWYFELSCSQQKLHLIGLYHYSGSQILHRLLGCLGLCLCEIDTYKCKVKIKIISTFEFYLPDVIPAKKFHFCFVHIGNIDKITLCVHI